MFQDLLDKILNCYSENKWRQILDLNENYETETASRILWVWPSEENLNFLKNVLFRLGARGLTSVGCGCGLLEWIIQQHLDLPVVGLEINREWWTSKYSTPSFIPLRYMEKEITSGCMLKEFALMFCYFNNGKAFREYVKRYRGRVIIIIGPGDGAGRHTDPLPFSPDFGASEWKLVADQEVKNTKDFIAVYLKQC